MTETRAQALAARRVTVDRRTSVEARTEAHRALRAARGPGAAPFSRSACSAAIVPAREFADVEAWRTFLEPLYPSWAVDLGVALFDSPTVVLLAPDVPPRARGRSDSKRIDVDYYAAAGFIGPDWLWKIEPGVPLGDDDEPACRAKVAAVVARSSRARARMRAKA